MWMYSASQALRFSEIFSQQLRISKQNIARLLYVHIHAKLQNFIQLPQNLTKLYHIKRNHAVKFHFSQRSSMNIYCKDKQWVKTHNLLVNTQFISF